MKKRKLGFIGLEYVFVGLLLIGGTIGVYIKSQDTMKETQKEGSIVLSDNDAKLQSDHGSPGQDLVSKIDLNPSIIYLENTGTSGESTVKLTPATSWNVKLKWESFFNEGYSEMTQSNSGYKVKVKGLERGTSKYKVTTEDGSNASAILTVQVGQPTTYQLSPDKANMDMNHDLNLVLSVEDNDWSTTNIKSWEIVDGKDIASLRLASDQHSATLTTNGTKNGGNVTVKVSLDDLRYGKKVEAYSTIHVEEDYTTTFDLNGGQGSFAPLKAASTRDVRLPSNLPTKTGYTFLGWKISYGGDLYQPGTTYKMPKQDNVMTAQWSANNYDIIFNLNYEGKLHSVKTLAYDTKLGLLPQATRVGCGFIGWFEEPSGITEVTSETKVPLNGATYYAKWSYNPYSIKFDLNGGTGDFPEISSRYGESVTLPSIKPVRANYDFIGWVSDYNGTSYQAGTSYVIPPSTTTLTAKWNAQTFSIIYNKDNGEFVNPGTVKYSYTTEDVVTVPDITKTGYTFGGWYGDAGFSTRVDAIPLESSGNKTLYAKWTANTYTLNFNANGGSVGTSSKAVTYGSAIGTLPTPSRSGYDFLGWTTDAGVGWSSGTVYNRLGSTTLYAQWSATYYTVTFNSNGGNAASPGSKTVRYGDAYGSMPTPSRTYYNFLGWFTGSGTQVTSGTGYYNTGNTVLYAHWQQVVSTLNFYNAITGAYNYQYIGVGNSTTATAVGASGYYFQSWTSSNNGVASISGNTAYVNGPGYVDIYSNWALINPGAQQFGGWGNTRDWYVNGSAASGVTYFMKPSSGSCDYSEYNQWPSNYENNGGSNYNHLWYDTYRCYKICTGTTNYNGTNRCSNAGISWIGADNQAPGSPRADTGFWAGGSTGHWTFYRGWDAMIGYSTRIGVIRGSWNSNMSGPYEMYYGGNNSYYMNGNVSWGNWGSDTTSTHNRSWGCNAWLFHDAKTQDQAGNIGPA
ncbi:MAG: InlB B-repeat-containing protein [Erysipelotrichaceae bacterium]